MDRSVFLRNLPRFAQRVVFLTTAIALISSQVDAKVLRVAARATSEYVQLQGSISRIAHASDLRMLSQKIAVETCRNQLNTSGGRRVMGVRGSLAEFDTILTDLETGNEMRGIYGPETRLRVLRSIEQLRQKFELIRDSHQIGRSDAELRAPLTLYVGGSDEFLDASAHVVAEISAQYANGIELLLGQVVAFDLAGRQRMLLQRLVKNACFISTGLNSEISIRDMHDTASLFDATLKALQYGEPSMGLGPTKSKLIAAALEKVSDNWASVHDEALRITGLAVVTQDAFAAFHHAVSAIDDDMQAVVDLYVSIADEALP